MTSLLKQNSTSVHEFPCHNSALLFVRFFYNHLLFSFEIDKTSQRSQLRRASEKLKKMRFNSRKAMMLISISDNQSLSWRILLKFLHLCSLFLTFLRFFVCRTQKKERKIAGESEKRTLWPILLLEIIFLTAFLFSLSVGARAHIHPPSSEQRE